MRNPGNAFFIRVTIVALIALGALVVAKIALDDFKEPPTPGLDASDLTRMTEKTPEPPVEETAKTSVALKGSVPAALSRFKKIHQDNSVTEPLMLTIVLKRTDQAGFEKFLADVNNSKSFRHRQYLSAEEQAKRFGPSLQTYEKVGDWLERQGFIITDDSKNHLTITVSGNRQQVERAFKIRLNDYRLDDRVFYSNDREPKLPTNIAAHVQAVIGLNNLARPIHVGATEVVLPPQYDPKGNLARSCWYAAQLLEEAKPRPFVIGGLTGYFCMAEQLNMLNLLASGPTTPITNQRLFSVNEPLSQPAGTGQKIGLLQFDNFVTSDVRDFLNLIGRSNQLSQLSQVHVAGGAGAPGAQESEVLLDIAAVMSLAPGAQVIVYDGPFNGRGSFQTMFNAMIGDGVDVISNSWAYCEDQTTLADVQSIDSILASAGAAGITVLNGSGDMGSTCLNGSANTCHVPASSPNATAVGGTTSNRTVGGLYGNETWWNSPLGGQGGFGTSRFFGRPSYQDGFTSINRRSVPDVTAPADPLTGYFICQASNGGCPTNLLYGGTSVAAPVWAAFVAVLNQQQSSSLGFLNPKLYPLANSNAFHSPAEMGSSFQEVGLGSPNVNLLHLALTSETAGPFSVAKSNVAAYPRTVVADGQTQAGIVVVLADANGNSVSGQTVQLTMNVGAHAVITTLNAVTNVSNGAALFTVTDTFLETVTFTATVNGIPLSQHPTVEFVSRPAAAGNIVANPTNVNANGTDLTTITVTLQDINGNPSPNKLVNLSQGNGSSTISSTNAITDATGKVQFTAANSVAQAVTYTAIDVTDGNLPVPGNAVVNFANASGFCANTNSYRFGTAAPGHFVTTFASSFPLDCFTGIGPIGLVFDASGNLLVGDASTNGLYKFGPIGGVAGQANLLGIVTPTSGTKLAGLTFDRAGRLYGLLNNGNNVVEIDQQTGAVIRLVAHINGGGKFALAIDPLSGDLFVSGFDGVERITNFASGPGTVTHYANGNFDGIVFAEDGTIYAAEEIQGVVSRITGTNSLTPGVVTTIAFLPGADGIALEANDLNPTKPTLFVNRNDGVITRIDTSTLPTTATNPCGSPCTDIYTGGSRGDFVTVGPSGCLYATQSDRILKLTKADGTCSLQPTGVAPQLSLTPTEVQPSPVQGSTTTFTATLRNVASLENVPVTFFISGANPSVHLVNTDVNGKAVVTYTGVATGVDRIFASADLATSAISSNELTVSWTTGKHSSFLTLNQSPSSGTPNQPLTLTANLADISVLPPVPISNASITFTLANQSCVATTSGVGMASCSITPTVIPGSYPLNATFSGTSSLLASSATTTVNLLDAVQQTVVQFSAPTYTVQEDCTTLIVNVNRIGDSSGPASVDYNTTDGQATERKDYITALGTLNFAAGETSKSIVVLVNEDSLIEGNETFNIHLGNPVGVALGTTATATITIVDDLSEPTTNSIDDPRTFVCQNYHDFLNRQPEPGGWDFWTNEITSCGTDANCIEVKRINVSAAFFLSIEFQETGYLVERIYKAAYGDASGTSGSHQLPVPIVRLYEFLRDTQRIGQGVVVLQPGWEQTLENNKQAFTNAFVATPRFIAAFPTNMTPTQFVDKLNMNAGNVLSTSERALAIGRFGGSSNTSNVLARAQGLRQVAEDQNLYTAEFNRAFVLMQYLGYLRRNPDDPQDTDHAGYEFWLNKLNQFNGSFINAEMVKAFIQSIEYRNRFAP